MAKTAGTIIVDPALDGIVERIVSEAAMSGKTVQVTKTPALPKRKTNKVILKEGMEKCRKILADVSLTAEEKVEGVKHTVSCFVENLIEVDSWLPEVRAWRKRDDAIMEKYYPKPGETFCCPTCDEFWPKRPSDVESNDAEFGAIRDRKAAELIRKILGGKVA